MIICGIDPGIARLGWGIIKELHGQLTTVAYGCIETPKTHETTKRLKYIHFKLQQLFKTHKPDAVAVEELFFATNAKTAILVGEARGVILLSASLADIPTASYTPLQVKQTMTGDGKADKIQVQRMVVLLLKLSQIPKPDDTADALAIALTHAYAHKLLSKTV